jgi:hypothetical protein
MYLRGPAKKLEKVSTDWEEGKKEVPQALKVKLC